MICTTKTNPKAYQGHYSPSDRRLRVLANAYYGLPVYSGLSSDGNERRSTEAIIRKMKAEGLIGADYSMTDKGFKRLSLFCLRRYGQVLIMKGDLQ
jgi:hypothetical protein